MIDTNIENWARIVNESVVGEDERAGHDINGSNEFLGPALSDDSPLRKAIAKAEDADIARAFSVIIDAIAWDTAEQMEKFKNEMKRTVKVYGSANGSGIGGILQAFYTILSQRVDHRNKSDREFDIDMHNISPKHYKHPDHIDPKDIPDRELPQ